MVYRTECQMFLNFGSFIPDHTCQRRFEISESVTMWDYFDGKCVFITGGSGFLGTAIVSAGYSHGGFPYLYPLSRWEKVSSDPVKCRDLRDAEGLIAMRHRALYARWTEDLPPQYADTLCKSDRLIVLNGDIRHPRMGLSDSQISMVRENAEIFIHAASSINLTSSLADLATPIVKATEMAAELALSCQHLTRFVYVSSAYANAHLGQRSELSDVPIDEKIYPPSHEIPVLSEWEEVQKTGTSPVFETEDHPWTYAYAKYLTERLLFRWFSDVDAARKLLVIRPSAIGPAQKLPYPGYCFPQSTPTTSAAAAFLLSKESKIRIATRCTNPSTEAYTDEVPVDVVVDRLLSHLALGTIGYVHAVSGKRARTNFVEWWQSMMQLRRIPWDLEVEWVYENWKTPNQHPVARLWVTIGSCLCFSEDRTLAIREQLVAHGDCLDLQLFTTTHMGRQLRERTKHLRSVMDEMAAKMPGGAEIVRKYYGNFGREQHGSPQVKARL